MRRFHVWAEVRRTEIVVEVEDGDDADDVCAEACDALIENGDSGWNELEPSEDPLATYRRWKGKGGTGSCVCGDEQCSPKSRGLTAKSPASKGKP
jgi:hypothetical protein